MQSQKWGQIHSPHMKVFEVSKNANLVNLGKKMIFCPYLRTFPSVFFFTSRGVIKTHCPQVRGGWCDLFSVWWPLGDHLQREHRGFGEGWNDWEQEIVFTLLENFPKVKTTVSLPSLPSEQLHTTTFSAVHVTSQENVIDKEPWQWEAVLNTPYNFRRKCSVPPSHIQQAVRPLVHSPKGRVTATLLHCSVEMRGAEEGPRKGWKTDPVLLWELAKKEGEIDPSIKQSFKWWLL